MQIRFLLGPAGSGKTFRCLAEVRAELKSAAEGLPLVLLAPKQSTFELERQLLAGPDPLPGYTRLQILSFERLAEFVLAEFSPSAAIEAPGRPAAAKKTSQHSDAQGAFPFWELTAARGSGSESGSADRGNAPGAPSRFPTGPPRILDEEGRVMVLRALLAQKQPELKIFRATARLPGFAQQLSLLLRELQRHQHSPEKLSTLAAGIHSPARLADKLHDLALLLRAYREWLQAHQLQDPNCLLDLATELLRAQLAPRDALRLGGLWLDGFAEMTPQELDFLAALTPPCARATLAFCLETEPPEQEQLSWLSTWSVVGETFRKCYHRLATLPGCKVEVEMLERKPGCGRFAASPVLAHLEKNWPQPKPFGGRATAQSGNEPTPDLSQEGNRQGASTPVEFPSREGSGVGRPTATLADCPALADTLRVAVCPNPEAEVVLAAREILRHVRAGGRYRECAVLLRALAGHQHPLRRVFCQYEIPFFLDRREPVAHHPLAELTRYALRIVALGWAHDDWFGALKTGLVPADEAELDVLENEALARGWKTDTWTQPLRIDDDRPLATRLEQLRERIVPPFQQLAERLVAGPLAGPGKLTGIELAAALRDFWTGLEIQPQLTDWSRAGTDPSTAGRPQAQVHETVFGQMQSWLDNVALAFSGEPLPLRDWLPILEAGLAGLTAGVVPPALDQVLVGTIDRSRNPDLQLALVLGLNESIFPALPEPPGLLNETDRDQLEARGVRFGPNRLVQLGRERYYGYIACTRARRRLVLTCAKRDGSDRVLNPSPFLTHLTRLFPSLTVEQGTEPDKWFQSEHACELIAPLLRSQIASGGRVPDLSSLAAAPVFDSLRERLSALASYSPATSISPGLAARLYGPVLRASVSALEQFAACPFKYFAQSGLGAEERKLFEADPREKGSFQHRILAQFHEQLRKEGKRWRDLAPAEARERIGQLAAQVGDAYRDGLFRATDQNRFAARALTSALQDFIETIVGWMPDYSFDPWLAELSFGGDGDTLPAWEIDLGEGLRLAFRGKIDRVDLLVNRARDEALCVVMDYKSGVKKIDPLLLEHGVQIQLPAYLAALRRLADPRPEFGVSRLVPAGVFYVSLRGSYKAGANRIAVLDGAGAARRLAYRHAGRFRLDALRRFDRHAPEPKSGQFNYGLTKDGKPDRRFADLIDAPKFNALLDQVERLLGQMGRRIFAGDVNVDPYRKGAETACDFCDYRGICRIDPWTHRFRVLTKNSSTSTADGPAHQHEPDYGQPAPRD